ncbi:hypothetical protein SLEP1_g6459 [Rubroshorea leprosula]|uniref:Uncharacterized protein n=1 Tax=Rubroshorea leprosula TaxID=152421 RepID=A0AAV5I3I0_9ROSI|nr:hypothetical protein SLEP1_g6459 [Rubroshorea leprosula]
MFPSSFLGIRILTLETITTSTPLLRLVASLMEKLLQVPHWKILSFLDLQTQLSYFKDVTKQLRQKLGDAEAKTLLSRAVYLIRHMMDEPEQTSESKANRLRNESRKKTDMSTQVDKIQYSLQTTLLKFFKALESNDYIFRLYPNSTLLQTCTKEEYVGMVIGNLTHVIKGIYKEGGRKFGLLNGGPLGCIPYAIVNELTDNGSCVEEATELAKLHNKALPLTLHELPVN